VDAEDFNELNIFDAEISGLVALIGLTYLIAVFVNIRRYK